MLVVSLNDFVSNSKEYFDHVQTAPVRIVDDNGVGIADVTAPRTGFWARLFKKQERLPGEEIPNRRLRAAMRECKKMEKHAKHENNILRHLALGKNV
mgnify:CR=1 FL=1